MSDFLIYAGMAVFYLTPTVLTILDRWADMSEHLREGDKFDYEGNAFIIFLSLIPVLNYCLLVVGTTESTVVKQKRYFNLLYKCSKCKMYFRGHQAKTIHSWSYPRENSKECCYCGETVRSSESGGHKMKILLAPKIGLVKTFLRLTESSLPLTKGAVKSKKLEKLKKKQADLQLNDDQMANYSRILEKQLEQAKDRVVELQKEQLKNK